MPRRPTLAPAPIRRTAGLAHTGGASSLLRLAAGNATSPPQRVVLPRASVLAPRRELPRQLSLFGPAFSRAA